MTKSKTSLRNESLMAMSENTRNLGVTYSGLIDNSFSKSLYSDILLQTTSLEFCYIRFQLPFNQDACH